MCGRAALVTPVEDLVDLFGLAPTALTLPPRYNIAPSLPVAAVVRRSNDGRRELALQRWGLIPAGAVDPSVGARMINARIESLTKRSAFREAARERRCIVLVDGFYEWRHDGKKSHPYFVRRRDGRPMALAGLWDTWQGAGAEPFESCTIVTMPSAPPVSRLHNRMPLVLEEGEIDAWLDPRVRAVAELAPLHRAPRADVLEAYSVSSRVNNPANEGPECTQPAEEEGTRSLFG
jgi:putative SOS response-associated peptidase YedK